MYENDASQIESKLVDDVTTTLPYWDLFLLVICYFIAGKSPLNHHLGEYVWNFFHPHRGLSKSEPKSSKGQSCHQISLI